MRSELYDAVREATRDEFDLVAELGGTEDWAVFLGRAHGGPLALLLLQEAEDGGEFELEVMQSLEAEVPVGRTTCATCDAREVGWPRFCAACGADLSGVEADAATPGESPAELLEEVRGAAEGVFEVLGAMSHAEGGGALYFAREVATGDIVGLALQQEAGGELALAVSWTPEGAVVYAPPAEEEVYPPPHPPVDPLPPAGPRQPEPGPGLPPLWSPPVRTRTRSGRDTRRIAGIAAASGVGVALVAALLWVMTEPPPPASAGPARTDLVSGGEVDVGPPADTVAAAAPAGPPPPVTDPGAEASRPVAAASIPPAQPSAQTVPVADPVQAAPAAEPPAPPTADGVEAAVRRYAQAVGSCQTSRIMRAYPGVTGAEVEGWERFFRQNCGAGLRAEALPESAVTVEGTRAELVFTLALRYTGATGSQLDQPLMMRAVLEWRHGAWSLQEVRLLGGR